jgi:hypothetical protein
VTIQGTRNNKKYFRTSTKAENNRKRKLGLMMNVFTKMRDILIKKKLPSFRLVSQNNEISIARRFV